MIGGAGVRRDTIQSIADSVTQKYWFGLGQQAAEKRQGPLRSHHLSFFKTPFCFLSFFFFFFLSF